MAVVNIVFAEAGVASNFGLVNAYNGRFSSAETLNSTGTSQATTITALEKNVARVKVTGGNIWLSKPAASPVAVVSEAWLILDGETFDLAGLELDDKLAVINAA